MAKTKLTDRLQADLIDKLKLGATLKGAAEACGISYRTLFNWMQRGQRELERAQDPKLKVRKAERPFVAFFHAVKGARRQAEHGLLALILQSAQGGQDIQSRTTTDYHKGHYDDLSGQYIDGPIKRQQTTRTKSAGQWAAAAWVLERSFGYTRTDQIKITAALEGEIDQLLDGLRGNVSEGALAELERYFGAAAAADPDGSPGHYGSN